MEGRNIIKTSKETRDHQTELVILNNNKYAKCKNKKIVKMTTFSFQKQKKVTKMCYIWTRFIVYWNTNKKTKMSKICFLFVEIFEPRVIDMFTHFFDKYTYFLYKNIDIFFPQMLLIETYLISGLKIFSNFTSNVTPKIGAYEVFGMLLIFVLSRPSTLLNSIMLS